ncbi:PD-(D/E)XK nuclease family protein [Corynebacterium pseudopelargi]|uniref:ATP-dependent helicase/deoxyribonuclease subunit B n=1 Tax=Corynebacterium pseudopelargi TaxID=2080757 RepID=A0A3G6ITR8_9CORY|nr:PD-(D/E)XK nuclease family protein [Corynebacterium pseudopelargi]AZA09013.1 ATP-dependent helicase/deoxyribonuclease subunit B [Corynebacterium pseudopelargi]
MKQTLNAALQSVRQTHPEAEIVVLCGQHARDDVIAQMTQGGAIAGVQVGGIRQYLLESGRLLAPRRPLQLRDVAVKVTAALQDEAPETEFHRQGINDEAVTREALAEAVLALLNLPAQRRDAHGGARLPAAVAALAKSIGEDCAEHWFTLPDVAEFLIQRAARRGTQYVLAGDIAFDTLSEWFVQQLPDDARHEVDFPAVTGQAEIEHHSFVSNTDEADFAAAQVLEAVAGGVPLHSIAVAYCNASQMGALHQALERAGIPFSAMNPRTWAQEPFARGIRQLLMLDPSLMPRPEVAALLASGILKDAPSLSSFDFATRGLANLNQGDDWIEKAEELKAVTEVKRFVNALAKQLKGLHQAESLAALAEALSQLRGSLLRKMNAEEQAFFNRLLDTMRQHQLSASAVMLAELSDQALATPLPSTQQGMVQLTSLEGLVGRSMQLCIICGASDDALPGSLGSNAAITPEQSGNTSKAFLDRRERAFQHALRASSKVLISHPRSLLVGTSKVERSPWADGDVHHHGPLIQEWHQASSLPATAFDLNLLAGGQDAQTKQQVQRFLHTMQARQEGEWAGDSAAFNGWIGPGLSNAVLEQQLSTSALELFTQNPLVFFIERILGQRVLEDSFGAAEIDARDRGTIYHRIFERWIREMWLDIASLDHRYSDVDFNAGVLRMREIAMEELNARRDSSIPGVMWQAFQTEVLRVSDAFVKVEIARSKTWRPIGVEVPFGRVYDAEDSPPLKIPLSNRHTLTLGGVIDRVDLQIDHESQQAVLAVLDYKSGKPKTYKAAFNGDEYTGNAKHGYRFQLAAYGEAIRQALAGTITEGPLAELASEVAKINTDNYPVTIVSGYLFFLDENFELIRIIYDDNAQAELEQRLAKITSFIADGAFPPYEISGNPIMTERAVRLGASTAVAASRLQLLGLTPLNIAEDEEQ